MARDLTALINGSSNIIKSHGLGTFSYLKSLTGGPAGEIPAAWRHD